MKHIYSNHLIAYLFEEIDPETKQNIERELASNSALRNELQELREGLTILQNCAPLSPSSQSIENILDATENAEAIPAH